MNISKLILGLTLISSFGFISAQAENPYPVVLDYHISAAVGEEFQVVGSLDDMETICLKYDKSMVKFVGAGCGPIPFYIYTFKALAAGKTTISFNPNNKIDVVIS
jgi:hypothetical protein